MADAKTSFWTPARIGAVIGAVLLIVALAYLVSLPQNQFQPADLPVVAHFVEEGW